MEKLATNANGQILLTYDGRERTPVLIDSIKSSTVTFHIFVDNRHGSKVRKNYVLNRWGVICSASKLDNGKTWYQFQLDFCRREETLFVDLFTIGRGEYSEGARARVYGRPAWVQTELVADNRTTTEKAQAQREIETAKKQRGDITEDLPLLNESALEEAKTVQLSLF
jgi:hypothetical protein